MSTVDAVAEALPEACPLAESERPETVRKSTAAGAPVPLRLMAARGMAPMPPRDLVTTQFCLLWDADEKVRESAEKSLQTLDPRLANAVLADPKVPPPVLARLAMLHADNETYIEKILLNPSLQADAVIAVARACSERIIANHIVTNQARLLEAPEIARGLAANPAARPSDVDLAVDFLVRNGVFLEDVRQFEESLLRLTGEERLKAAAATELPPELLDDRFRQEHDPSTDRRLITEDEEDADDTKEKLNLEQEWRNFSVAQKVAAATLGNKAVRTLALREPNRMIALAAASSPAITESEIVAAAGSKTVHRDVIGYIIRDRKNNWVRLYPVKVAVVNNPKTNLPDAMKLVPSLNPRDLKAVSRSKNVPGGVRAMATKLVKAKQM